MLYTYLYFSNILFSYNSATCKWISYIFFVILPFTLKLIFKANDVSIRTLKSGMKTVSRNIFSSYIEAQTRTQTHAQQARV